MCIKKVGYMVLACLLIVGVICVPADAAETKNTALETPSTNLVSPRATESFNITVSAYKTASANTSFPMTAGETVTFQAYYSPSSASVDFGLVDSSGTYYYFTATDGNIDKTMVISENGDYTFLVRNNSSSKVDVTGFVRY